MFDGDKDPISVGIVELEIVGLGAVCSLQATCPSISAETVGGMDDEFTELKWGHEIRGHLIRLPLRRFF